MKECCLFFALLLALITFHSEIHAQNTQKPTASMYSVQGIVRNESGESIAGAAVFITKKDDSSRPLYSTSSNDVGFYRFEEVKTGAFVLNVFFSGMAAAKQAIEVKDKNLSIDISLKSLSGSLDEIVVGQKREKTFGITRLESVEGMAIYDAKKSEVVVVDDVMANKATNNARQVYAKVSGLNIWESDGAGVQLALGGRGLNPNRNANFNTRQNGYDISADALGYPESYYTPPIQALRRIEIVRGAASLQYGTQFGGLVNFQFKDGPEDKPFELNTNQSVGSFGLFNSFNSVGGTAGKVNYYGFYQFKRSDGWRPNSGLHQHTAYFKANIRVTPEFTITPEYTFHYYQAQQPGGLTDAQFRDDPRQSNRERNWFSVNWNLFALTADYQLSGATRINSRFFGLIAGRDALGNLGRIDRVDFGGNRDLLKDDFRNWGNETRLIHRYGFGEQISVFLIGTRYYSGSDLQRQGDGSDQADANFDFNNPNDLEVSDFDLGGQNVSVFAENIFNISPKISITPGARFEYIKTETDGFFKNMIRDLAGNIIFEERIEEERENERSFVFFGLGASYKHSPAWELYANFSQNYRAINFNDIRVNVGSLEVDPNISDERGFNVDLGSRGNISGVLNYDITLFHLSYRDRIGTVLKREPNPVFNNLVDRTFRLRTNIADAQIFGIESFVEADLLKLFVNRNSAMRLSVFSNLAVLTSRYSNSGEPGIEGNEVELVPPINFKTGITLAKNQFEASFQYSYVKEHFSDASNAESTPSAIEGKIPSYQVMDLAFKYTFQPFQLEAGVNNLADEAYFTRRATGYPGPGIIPSTGRNMYFGVEVKF